MKITKMHALGNNYIYVNQFEERLREEELPELAIAISDIRRGIGSDGLILIGPSDKAEVRMRIFNADGSEAETCGNGLRCVAKYVYDRQMVRSSSFAIEVRTGVVQAHVHDIGGRADRVTIDMGAPEFGAAAVHASNDWIGSDSDDEAVVEVGGTAYVGTLVSMGNPHFVSFVDDARAIPVASVGPKIERHVYFPNRINVEFVTPRSRRELDFFVWERGSGITFACGTGACASVAAGVKKGLLDANVTVHLLGGDLEIEVRQGRIFMTGEAVEVMSGEYVWNGSR